MVSIGRKRLTSGDFEKVLYQHEKIQLDPVAVEKINLNFNFLKTYSKDKVIYGINTGFGPMAQYKINDSDQRQLQYNLIRSHSSGSGDIFSEDLSRATMLARLNGLMQGSSGIHQETVLAPEAHVAHVESKLKSVFQSQLKIILEIFFSTASELEQKQSAGRKIKKFIDHRI